MKSLLKTMLLAFAMITLSATTMQAQTVAGVLQPDPESLNFSTSVGVPVSEVVEFSVLNQDFISRLTSPLLEAKITGTNSNQFSVDSNNISVFDILASVLNGHPVDVEVTYNPTSTGTHYGILVLKLPDILGIGVTLATVELTGVAH